MVSEMTITPNYQPTDYASNSKFNHTCALYHGCKLGINIPKCKADTSALF